MCCLEGTEEPHEKRLLTLLGVDDETLSPQLRIVTFNPSGNGKYYPALKFRPEPDSVPHPADGASHRLVDEPDLNSEQHEEPESASPHRTGLRIPGITSTERETGSTMGEPTDRVEGLRGSKNTGTRTDEELLVSFEHVRGRLRLHTRRGGGVVRLRRMPLG